MRKTESGLSLPICLSEVVVTHSYMAVMLFRWFWTISKVRLSFRECANLENDAVGFHSCTKCPSTVKGERDGGRDEGHQLQMQKIATNCWDDESLEVTVDKGLFLPFPSSPILDARSSCVLFLSS